MRRLFSLLLASLVGSAVALGARYLFPSKSPQVVETTEQASALGDSSMRSASEAAAGPAAPPPHPTGYVFRGGVVLVQMSDGTRRWHDRRRPDVSDGIESVTPSSVTIQGDKEYIKPLPRVPAPPVQLPSAVASLPGGSADSVHATQSVAPLPVDAPNYPPSANELRSTYSIHRRN